MSIFWFSSIRDEVFSILVGLKQALEDLLGCRVHVVSEPALKRSRRERILAEARPI